MMVPPEGSRVIALAQIYAQVVGRLAELLDVEFVPGSAAFETPLGRSVARVGQLYNTRPRRESDWELMRLALLTRGLDEIEAASPDVRRRVAARLLTRDLPSYFGARQEAAIAASLARKGLPFEYEPSGGPDFVIRNENPPLGIECTSAHISGSAETPDLYVVDPDKPGPKDLGYKLARAIQKKAKRPYATTDVALAIDSTNLQALSAGEQLRRDSAEAALATSGFGAALIFSFHFDLADQSLSFPYTRHDAPGISAGLRAFLDRHFPFGDYRIEEHVTPLVP